MMPIPVSCRHNTWSLLHVSPRHNTHEGRLGSRGPSTPHFVGVLLDLESKVKKEDKIKYTACSCLDERGCDGDVITAFINIKLIHYSRLEMHYNNTGHQSNTEAYNSNQKQVWRQ